MKPENYTQEQFIEDVMKEATALRDMLTENERDKLNFSKLDPESPTYCVYGQISGNCVNSRAHELIFACCARYIYGTEDGVDPIRQDGFDYVVRKVNGEKVVDIAENLTTFRHTGGNTMDYFSALEMYILMPWAKNENLIAYLRGETEVIDL